MMTERCADCRFMRAPRAGVEPHPTCRADAPTGTVNPRTGSSYRSFGAWPAIDLSDWCGRFVERDAVFTACDGCSQKACHAARECLRGDPDAFAPALFPHSVSLTRRPLCDVCRKAI